MVQTWSFKVSEGGITISFKASRLVYYSDNKTSRKGHTKISVYNFSSNFFLNMFLLFYIKVAIIFNRKKYIGRTKNWLGAKSNSFEWVTGLDLAFCYLTAHRVKLSLFLLISSRQQRRTFHTLKIKY